MTKKSVDQILDKAADILEKDGWVTTTCYDSATGGKCALGAIAAAVHPQIAKSDPFRLDYLGFIDRDDVDPRHAEAVKFLASTIDPSMSMHVTAEYTVYEFNDRHASGIRYDWDDENKRRVASINEAVRLESSAKVVAKLRAAAKQYRQDAAAEQYRQEHAR